MRQENLFSIAQKSCTIKGMQRRQVLHIAMKFGLAYGLLSQVPAFFLPKREKVKLVRRIELSSDYSDSIEKALHSHFDTDLAIQFTEEMKNKGQILSKNVAYEKSYFVTEIIFDSTESSEIYVQKMKEIFSVQKCQQKGITYYPAVLEKIA